MRVRLYYGLFGRRGPRPYAGLWTSLFGGAVGISLRGKPWCKMSGRRLWRLLDRGIR